MEMGKGVHKRSMNGVRMPHLTHAAKSERAIGKNQRFHSMPLHNLNRRRICKRKHRSPKNIPKARIGHRFHWKIDRRRERSMNRGRIEHLPARQQFIERIDPIAKTGYEALGREKRFDRMCLSEKSGAL